MRRQRSDANQTAFYALPYPPSVNHYWYHRGRGKVISEKGRAYRDEVCAIVKESGAEKLTCRLELHVALTMPDRRKRDIDNTLKALQDALQVAGAYDDDCQIDKLTIERGSVERPGCAFVWLREILTDPREAA